MSFAECTDATGVEPVEFANGFGALLDLTHGSLVGT
jgi:hypothetical protein